MKSITKNIAIQELYAHPDNPRKDIGDISELAESIRVNGIMQDLTVVPKEDEGYMILIGHRRYAAAKKAGLKYVPCKVLENIPDRAKQIAIMLEENMQRNDLTPLEEARSFQICLDLGETVASLSEKTGFSKTTIRRRLDIAKLDADSLEEKEFQLSLTELHNLSKIDDPEKREDLVRRASGRENLNYMVQTACREQEINAAYEKLAEKLKEIGMQQAPANTKVYSDEWEIIKDVRLFADDTGDVLEELKDAGECFFYKYPYGSNISIIRKKVLTDKEEKEKVEKKKEEKKKREEQEKMKVFWEQIGRKIIECIKMIVEEKTLSVKNEKEHQKILDDLSTACVLSHVFMNPEYAIRWFLSGQERPSKLTRDEENEMDRKICAASVEEKLFMLAAYQTDTCITETYNRPWSFDLLYQEKRARSIVLIAKCLAFYGFSLTEEEEEILNGTHGLYAVEEENS